LGEISIYEAMEMAAQKGAEVALKEFFKLKKIIIQEYVDKRFHNTELLLKHYRGLVAHKNDAVYSREKAIQILGEIDYEDEKVSFESIKKSAERTTIVVAHIDKMMKDFYVLASSEEPELLRGYKILMSLYVDDEKKSPEEICFAMSVTQRTFYRNKKAAIQFLSAIVFGIDGVKFR
jgi:hypothetical protein